MPIDGGTGKVEVKVGDNVAPLTVDVVTINQAEPPSRSQRPGWPISIVFGG